MFNPDIRNKYFQLDTRTRLGSIAADLARIASFAEFNDDKAVEGLLEESKVFIEWSAPDLLPDRLDDAVHLVDIQRELISWQRRWQHLLNNQSEREKHREQA